MSQSKQAGMSLIEVLISLMIIAIALTAAIKMTTDHIRSNIYLREKTIATTIALNVIRQTQLGLMQWPETPYLWRKNVVMLNQIWQWEGFVQKTPYAHIHQLQITVFHQPEHRLITKIIGYIYAI